METQTGTALTAYLAFDLPGDRKATSASPRILYLQKINAIMNGKKASRTLRPRGFVPYYSPRVHGFAVLTAMQGIQSDDLALNASWSPSIAIS
jgi:hypothetical protein